MLGFEPAAEDELGAAAADVDDQALAGGRRAVRYPEIDEAGFLDAADDFHLIPKRFFGALQKFSAVTGLSQGIGSNDADMVSGEIAQTLTKLRQTRETALLRVGTEAIAGTKPGGKPNHFAQAVQNAQLPVDHVCHDHVEAVGTEIDGCQSVASRLW
jgi:hypothetical protein